MMDFFALDMSAIKATSSQSFKWCRKIGISSLATSLLKAIANYLSYDPGVESKLRGYVLYTLTSHTFCPSNPRRSVEEVLILLCIKIVFRAGYYSCSC